MPAERKTQPKKTITDRVTDLEADSSRADKSDSRSLQIEEDASDLKLKITTFDGNFTVLMRSADKTERALWGSDGDIGIIGRLSKVEDIIADMKRLMWLVLAVVVSLAVGGVWEVLSHRLPTP